MKIRNIYAIYTYPIWDLSSYSVRQLIRLRKTEYPGKWAKWNSSKCKEK